MIKIEFTEEEVRAAIMMCDAVESKGIAAAAMLLKIYNKFSMAIQMPQEEKKSE